MKPRGLKELEDAARETARLIDGGLPAGVGFTLLLFEVGGPDGWATYISNARREDMKEVLRKLLRKWESEDRAGS